MVLLCFLIDLRSLAPPHLRDLKQALMQLGNYYALLSPRSADNGDVTESKPLIDLIGLFYVFRNRISCSDKMEIAYSPEGNFNLRDFHHALNNLPPNSFSAESNDFGALYHKDFELTDVLDQVVICSSLCPSKDIKRKIIIISSCPVGTFDYVTKESLVDATGQCVSLEFVFLEQTSSFCCDVNKSINEFVKQITDDRNCSVLTCIPDLSILFGLAKRWFQEIKDYKEGELQAHFFFRINLMSTLNHISCNLCTFFNPILDGFTCCQTCRCHGIPLDHSNSNQSKRSSCCSVSKNELGAIDICENSIEIGGQTILYMPSFQSSHKLQKFSSPIKFNVIQRTQLSSLSEGLIIGATYVVTPSAIHDTDDKDKSELNNQLFQAICNVLNSLDEGLICTSNCNLETSMETSFNCYYVLLPSDKGLMVLRRLIASEEFFPIFDVSRFSNRNVVKDIESTVQESLLKMQINDYNPTQHERGFHQKLNLLVKQSLHVGKIIVSEDEEASPKSILSQQDQSSELVGMSFIQEETPQLDLVVGKAKTTTSLTEKWEPLVVEVLLDVHSPLSTSNSKQDQPITTSSQNNRKLLEKTSRILERLENPRQIKRKVDSATTSSSLAATLCPPAKIPLIPFESANATTQCPVGSQLMRPNFQRTKKDKDRG